MATFCCYVNTLKKVAENAHFLLGNLGFPAFFDVPFLGAPKNIKINKTFFVKLKSPLEERRITLVHGTVGMSAIRYSRGPSVTLLVFVFYIF